MAYYEFWYCSPTGQKISHIGTVSDFSYALIAGDVGILQLNTPLQGLPHETIAPDYRIHVYRQPYGGQLYLELIVFLDLFGHSTGATGIDTFNLQGVDHNDLLRRRIIAAAAGADESDFSGTYVSNEMTLLARRVIGTAAGTGRELTDYGITVPGTGADIDAGGAIEKQAAWKNALLVLQDMQGISKTGGEEIFFGFVPATDQTAVFRVHPNQWGADRTQSGSGKPVVFGLEYGNLQNPRLQYNYAIEANYIYAGGKGEGADRIIQEAEDTAATGRAGVARRERFINATRASTTAGVADIADDGLTKYRPQITLTADLVSTPSTTYGVHWEMGDLVTISYQGIQADTVIRGVSVSVDGNGRETVQARIELNV